MYTNSNRQPDNRQPTTDNRQLRTENRQLRTENRQLITDNREPRTDNFKTNKMNKRFKLIIAMAIISMAACTIQESDVPDQDFNKGWLFHKGEAEGAEAANFDDSQWRELDLPHDWAAEGPFSDEYNARTGGLPVHGTGWYRKHFTIDASMKNKRISVEFDGAMNNNVVWVNGEKVGDRPYGYIGFEFDITDFVNVGKENVIAVRLKPEDLAARWYSGAGIYRNVRIKYNSSVHIPQYGTFITTPEVSDEKATVNVLVDVLNAGAKSEAIELATTIYDQEGNEVVKAVHDFDLGAVAKEKIENDFHIENPKRWDLDTPYLYTAKSEIIKNGAVVDVYETEFGIRTIEFTPNDGFLLNGRRVQFKGVCMHHDLGPLGTAFNYRARERQMEIMKSMGVNALRTSHNPPEPEWLEICDRMGILVQVEAFDEWKKGKVPNGYNKVFDEWHEQDLRDMIRRDRNHPSVVMWSIGNEILEQSQKDGWKLTKHLNDIVKDEDTTRPTTAGFNYYPAPYKNKLAFEIDVVGLNYWPIEYKELKEKYPDMILYGSETSSQTSSRGVYHLPIDPMPQMETNHVSSYDVIVGPPWAYPPDAEWDALEAEPASLGEFIWTGFDYIGEPTPYGGRDNSTHGYWNDNWPSHSSYFAPVDLCGFPKDRYYLYQSQWTDEPMVHVLPHWNWEGMGGKKIPVFAYTNCEEVELFINGKSYGKKVKGVDLTPIPAEYHSFKKGTFLSKYRLSWEVPYQPGEIKVIAYTDGNAKAEKTIKTAAKPAKIVLSADRSEINANGEDLSFITVKIVDEEGNFCPLADNKIEFEVEGAGSLAGIANGDQTCLTVFGSKSMKVFNGLMLAVVKSTEETGTIKLIAKSNGLIKSEITVNTK